MTIRDILVCLDSSTASDERLRLALILASSRKASLTAIFILPEPRITAPLIGLGPLPDTPPLTLAPAAGPSRNPERAEDVERRFYGELRSTGIEGDWYVLDGRNLAELVDYANTADLIILGQQSGDARGEGVGELAPEAVILEIGRPVLIIPRAGTYPTVGRRPLIAWDGCREAARALGDALPLIEAAEAATVIHVATQPAERERGHWALDRAVRHLQRHKINAAGEEIPGDKARISDLLLSRAADRGADVIVAGAYHHSPLREALLGGVSRELLQNPTVPVLMSH
jgi:nucleotide-binding universal stress UspA family protein